MTRQRPKVAIEYDDEVDKAARAFKKRKFKSIAAAARTFKVSYSTLKHRVRGRKTRVQSHERQQILTPAEESELARWITQLTTIGYPPGFSLVREMAAEIQKLRVRQINDDSIEHISYPRIAKQWVNRFLTRYPELKSTVGKTIDAARLKDVSKEKLMAWFHDVQRVFTENNIDTKNVYNMDESGFSIGKINATRVIIDKRLRTKYQAQPGRQEWVSVVECICADGTSVSPLVIFRGENLSNTWVPADIPESWRFSCNSRGWTSNIHSLEWLRRCFEPTTREKADGQKRVLICDGHGSHVTANFIRHCRENNIELLILPPHSSHITQPLDVAVFGPLKQFMAAELQKLIHTEIHRVQKAEWTCAYIRAREQAFSTLNIIAAFSGTGLFPFQPQKVLRRVPDINDLESTSSETDTSEAFPLDPSLLPSSPVDISSIQTARQSLSRYMTADTAFQTPVRNFVDRFGKSSERLWARTSVLEAKYNALKEVQTQRKARETGARIVLKGKHIVTGGDILERLENVKRPAGGKVRQKGAETALQLELSLSGEDTGPSDKPQVLGSDIADCIVVEF
jgi:hypothetical protein